MNAATSAITVEQAREVFGRMIDSMFASIPPAAPTFKQSLTLLVEFLVSDAAVYPVSFDQIFQQASGEHWPIGPEEGHERALLVLRHRLLPLGEVVAGHLPDVRHLPLDFKGRIAQHLEAHPEQVDAANFLHLQCMLKSFTEIKPAA